MKRRIILAAILVVAPAAYLLLLGFSSIDLPDERRLGTEMGAGPRVQVYLEVVGVDAVRDAMQVKVSIEPTGLAIDAQSMLPDRELILVMEHEKRRERIQVHASQPLQATPIELDLFGGDIVDYPLDAYRTGLVIRCLDASAASGTEPATLPIQITIWERVIGFRLTTSEEPSGVTGEDRLFFQIRRSWAFTFFALADYGAMLVLACIALTIGTLTFLGIRRPEATLMGALGAIVFALPALRNALPGGAPLGISADLFVFLWAELAGVLALALLVASWARAGPVP